MGDRIRAKRLIGLARNPHQTHALGALRYPHPLSRDEAGQILDNLTAFQSSSSVEPGRRSLADHRRGAGVRPPPGAAGRGPKGTWSG